VDLNRLGHSKESQEPFKIALKQTGQPLKSIVVYLKSPRQRREKSMRQCFEEYSFCTENQLAGGAQKYDKKLERVHETAKSHPKDYRNHFPGNMECNNNLETR